MGQMNSAFKENHLLEYKAQPVVLIVSTESFECEKIITDLIFFFHVQRVISVLNKKWPIYSAAELESSEQGWRMVSLLCPPIDKIPVTTNFITL